MDTVNNTNKKIDDKTHAECSEDKAILNKLLLIVVSILIYTVYQIKERVRQKNYYNNFCNLLIIAFLQTRRTK